eukprot:1153811-Pelagomonas_calceolata.AAC.2
MHACQDAMRPKKPQVSMDAVSNLVLMCKSKNTNLPSKSRAELCHCRQGLEFPAGVSLETVQHGLKIVQRIGCETQVW